MTTVVDKDAWSFYVDTGGTFTDCIGCSPDDKWFRAKVLSRGSFSAEAVEQTEDRTLKISKTDNWPEDFPVGFTLKVAGEENFSTRINRWDASSQQLILQDSLPAGVDFPIAIELESGWEAPVLGMRLILARQGLDWKSIRCGNAVGHHPLYQCPFGREGHRAGSFDHFWLWRSA
jgi:hypothetical protein